MVLETIKWHHGQAVHAYTGRDVPFEWIWLSWGGFPFAPADLSSQDQSLPTVGVVWGESLTLFPTPLCVRVMVMECSFPDLPSYEG